MVDLAFLLVAASVLAVPFAMAEMGFLHHRGNFHRWPMYVPVAFPPLFAAAGFLLLVTDAPWAYWTFAAASALLVLMGLWGVFFHVQGVARRTGGFNLDNVMVGPPLLAPLAFAAIGGLALLALAFWKG